MNISKEQFSKLAKEHLIALEGYKIDENGNKPIEIFGIEKLYEAINVIQCCTELCECDAPIIRTNIKGGEYCAVCEKDL
tara:strand:+ start:1508 stop:1744 length:237 start_codon:yes stop_codon:yes gene_type:complete